MRRSWTEAGTGLALALALTSCGGGGKDAAHTPSPQPTARAAPAPRPPSDVEQLDRLLHARAAALQRGDARAYAATAAATRPAQRARDRAAARHARGLGLSDVAYSVTGIDQRPGRATMDVRAMYAVRGVPGRFTSERGLTAVRTPAGWRIARETVRRERHPWELGAVARRRSAHFLIFGPPALAGDPALTGALEQGRFALRAALPGRRLPRRLLVLVAPTARDAGRLTRGIRGVARLAAITDSRVREAGAERRAAEVVSQRLLVVWPVFGALDAQERDRIVTHELTHAALAGTTSGRTPAWLIEGFALYTSGDRRVEQAAEELREPDPPTLRALARPDGIARTSATRQTGSYAYASAAAFYLAERFGPRAALRLYAAFNDPAIRGGAGARTTDRAMRAALGISLARFERGLRRWIADRAAP